MNNEKPKETPILIKMLNEPRPIPRKVPDYMRKKGGAWYWTGAMVTTAFLYEVITGLIILMYYQPSHAYTSTENFVNSVPFGSIILTTHLYAAYVMIVLVYVHLIRNLLVAAYKKPRMMQWLTGVLLLALTVGIGFFGYSMSGDVLSADATDVGTGIARGIPIIGNYLSLIFFGDGTPVSLFHRMLGWHIVLAAGIGILFMGHFIMAEYNSIMPSHKDANYRAPAIDEEKPEYKPWYPNNLFYMLQIGMLTIAAILIITSVVAALGSAVPPLFSPFPQVSPSSPLAQNVPAYPPWFLLFVYKAVDFSFMAGPGPFYATLIFAGIPVFYLLLLPYLDRSPSLKLTERPITLGLTILGIIFFVGLSTWGALTPGVSIPTSQVVAFFLLPILIVLPLVYFLSKNYQKTGMDAGHFSQLAISMSLLGVSGFGLGMLLDALIMYGNPVYYVPSILMAMVVALLVTLVAYTIWDSRNTVEKKQHKPLSRKMRNTLGGAFTLGAFVLITVIQPFSTTSTFQESLFGIGLGIVVLIAAANLKLYRSVVLGE